MKQLIINIKDKLFLLRREVRNNKLMLVFGATILVFISIDFSSSYDRSSSSPGGATFIGATSFLVFILATITSLITANKWSNSSYRLHSKTRLFSISLLITSALLATLTIFIHGNGSMTKWLIDTAIHAFTLATNTAT